MSFKFSTKDQNPAPIADYVNVQKLSKHFNNNLMNQANYKFITATPNIKNDGDKSNWVECGTTGQSGDDDIVLMNGF